MPLSRFWSSFWTVAGFLFLLGLLQILVDQVLTLFGLVGGRVASFLLLLSGVVVPAWGALTYADWRWGWKPDNAGLRTGTRDILWLAPGLAAGALAGVLAHLLTGFLEGGAVRPALDLTPSVVALAAIGAAGAFTTELVFRGVVASRFQHDLSGRDVLILATAMPLVWELVQVAFRGVFFISPQPDPAIAGLGTLALSVFLTLLFLRTDSVWLTAGIRAGLGAVIPLPVLGLSGGPGLNLSLLRWEASEISLLIVFGIPALTLLLLDINRLNMFRRPQARRARRPTFGKTIRGPWGPH